MTLTVSVPYGYRRHPTFPIAQTIQYPHTIIIYIFHSTRRQSASHIIVKRFIYAAGCAVGIQRIPDLSHCTYPLYIFPSYILASVARLHAEFNFCLHQGDRVLTEI